MCKDAKRKSRSRIKIVEEAEVKKMLGVRGARRAARCGEEARSIGGEDEAALGKDAGRQGRRPRSQAVMTWKADVGLECAQSRSMTAARGSSELRRRSLRARSARDLMGCALRWRTRHVEMCLMPMRWVDVSKAPTMGRGADGGDDAQRQSANRIVGRMVA